jgi:hypothetical protein
MTKFIGTPLRGIEFANPGDEAISSRVSGDTQPRLRIDAGGRITWSDGTSSGDTVLFRSSANSLTTYDSLTASAGLITLTTNGVPNAALPNGAIAIDTTNHVFYFRSNNEWLEVSGGATVTVDDSPPLDPEIGDLWYSSLELELFIYYSDAWIQLTDAQGGVQELYELADVLIEDPLYGQTLVYNGTEWENDFILTAESLQTARAISLAGDVSGSVAFDGSQNVSLVATLISGNASTASILQSPRTISLSGDISGSVAFDGSQNVSISATIQPNSVALGADTTGNYINDLTAGTGVTVTHTPGEGSSPTVAIGQAVGTSASVTFANVTADLVGDVTGNASTASTLQNSRTISLSGDVAGSVSFNGSADASITATIQPNSVDLGTDTTGNYVSSLVAGTGIALSNNSGESATPTVALNATLNNLSDVTIDSGPQIGDTGPAGGKIFITPTTAGNSTGRYFEAGPYLDPDAARSWAGNGAGDYTNETLEVTGADGTAIGTGAQNTIDITAQSGNTAAGSAAVYCSEYTYGGFSDWFLPSKDELNQLYINRASIGGFHADFYQSSSEGGADSSFYQDFSSGSQGNAGKGELWRVRPVRSFTASGGVQSGDFLKYDGSEWVNDQINLGTDTTGNYVNDLTAGTGVTITHTPGEGSSPTVAIGQAVGTSASVTFAKVDTTGDLTVGGNLTVNGTTTTLNTETLLVEDNIVVLNSGVTEAPTLNSGIEIERGTSTNVVIRWNETNDQWEFTNDGTTYGDIAALGTIELGTDTIGDYVNDVVAGTGISVTHTPGEGSSASIALNATLDNLSDVVITSPLQFQGLMYDGTNWVNSNIPDVYLVRNNTGSTILKGTLVGAVGAEPSGRIDVAPFQVTGTENSELRAMGIATSNISSGVNGEVMSFGTLTGLDTRGSTASALAVGDETWAAGDILFAHPTVDGKLTNVRPQHDLAVAFITVRHASSGQIAIRIIPGNNHLEWMHDVVLSSPTDGQFLRYNSASTVWVNDEINLGTDTVGNYMSDLTQGTGVTITHTPGEGSNATIGIGQAVATTSSVTFANVTSTGNVTISGRIDKTTIRESVADASVSASVVTADYATGDIFYVDTAPGSNFTVNLTNAPTDNGKAITVVIFVTQGATGYYPNVVQVAGSAQTIKWANGAAPTPTSSAGKIDIFSFTFVRRSSAWTVFGSSNLGY